jgi:hypothetical protein
VTKSIKTDGSSERLPDEFRGANRVKTAPVKTVPRTWTQQEVDWCLERRAAGWTYADLAEATGRSETSVSIKIKRMSKADGSYNTKRHKNKYLGNQTFLDCAKIQTVLDLYAADSWWKAAGLETLTNDTDHRFDTDYHTDAFKLASELYFEGKRFDLVDLDPYGSAYDVIPFGLRLARVGLVVSFGEWGHRRWKRLDFVEPRYGITKLAEFSEDAFVREIQRQARTQKMEAKPVISLRYGAFLRVYFTLHKFKQTSQWENANDDESRLF